MKSSNKKQLQNKLEFLRYAKTQRRYLVEFIHKYPDLFKQQDLKDFDKTIFELYLLNNKHNIFEQITFTPFKNEKQLFNLLFLNEQINQELLNKEVTPALKSQIVAVDNIYKFFNTLINSPLKNTGIAKIAANYQKEVEAISEELNSMFGMGQAKGVSGLLRRGVGLASRLAGAFSPEAGMVQEGLFSFGANVGAGVGTSVAMSKIAQSIGAKLDRYKQDENDIRNEIIDLVKKYGLNPALQLLGSLARQYGVPMLLRVVSSALGKSPLAQSILAGLSTTAGMAAVGVAAGAGVATAGMAFGGKKSLEARAQTITKLKGFQSIFQNFFQGIKSNPTVLNDWELFQEYGNEFPELTIRVDFYKKNFGNDIQAFKKAVLETASMLEPYYAKSSSE